MFPPDFGLAPWLEENNGYSTTHDPKHYTGSCGPPDFQLSWVAEVGIPAAAPAPPTVA